MNFLFLLAGFGALACVDMYSTYSAMKQMRRFTNRYSDYEVNPILRNLIKYLGLELGTLIGFFWSASVLTVLLYFLVQQNASGIVTGLFMVYILLLVIHINNAKIIKTFGRGERMMRECNVDILRFVRYKRGRKSKVRKNAKYENG